MSSELGQGLPPETPPSSLVSQAPESTVFTRMHPVLFAILALGAIFFLYQLIGGGIVVLVAGGKIDSDNVLVIRWSTIAAQLLFILIPTLIIARLRNRDVRRFLQLGVPRLREVLAAVVGVFALEQMLVGYMALQDLIPLPTELQKFLDMVKRLYEEMYRTLLIAHSPLEFIGVVIVVALVPAVSEELLFRGLVQRSLEETTGGWGAAVLTGVIFGAYHLIPTSLVPLAVLGVYLGFLAWKTQNIAVAMSAHFFNNFVACLTIYMHLDEDFIAVAPSGGAGATAMAANFAVFTLVFFASTAYLVFITRPVRVNASP